MRTTICHSSGQNNITTSNNVGNKILALLILMATLLACAQPADPNQPSVEILAAQTQSDGPITATVRPNNLTEFWVTTDGVDPVPNASCRHTSELGLSIDRTSDVRVLFNDGINNVLISQSFIINGTSPVNGFTNEEIISVWDAYNVHIAEQFKVANGGQAPGVGIHTIDDGAGGTVTLDHSEPFLKILTYTTYNGYNYNGFQVDSGIVVFYYSLLFESRGYIKSIVAPTSIDNEVLAPLYFSGTYNGSALGDFDLHQDGDVFGPENGEYQINCSDTGCAGGTVTYTYDPTTQLFLEVGAPSNENLLSCN